VDYRRFTDTSVPELFGTKTFRTGTELSCSQRLPLCCPVYSVSGTELSWDTSGLAPKCPDTSEPFIWYRSVLVPKYPGTDVSCYLTDCCRMCNAHRFVAGPSWPFNHQIKTAQQRTIYSNTVIGTLAVDGWAATPGTTRTGLGGPLLAVPNVTAHPSTASVPTLY